MTPLPIQEIRQRAIDIPKGLIPMRQIQQDILQLCDAVEQTLRDNESWKKENGRTALIMANQSHDLRNLQSQLSTAEKEILDRRGQLDLEIHAGMKLKEQLTTAEARVKSLEHDLEQAKLPRLSDVQNISLKAQVADLTAQLAQVKAAATMPHNCQIGFWDERPHRSHERPKNLKCSCRNVEVNPIEWNRLVEQAATPPGGI